MAEPIHNLRMPIKSSYHPRSLFRLLTGRSISAMGNHIKMFQKQEYMFNSLPAQKEKLNDMGIRAVLVPLFGITIPLITRMVPHDQFTNWQIKFSYLYTIGIAFIIYEGTRFLQFTLRSYFDWVNKPFKKILALIFTVPFYCVPVSMLMLVGWYHLFMNGKVNWEVIRLSCILILVCVFFLVNLYETVFLIRDVTNDRIRQEQLERAKAEAELEALKNQIDPHFIFNSLNTLAHLIEEKPGKAKQFNEHLADVYRYILQNKQRDLVQLADEIIFLKDYFSLLKIRFEDAVQLHIQIPDETLHQYLIPTISLQILAENAIKHNEYSQKQPLSLELRLQDNVLIIQNPLRKKTHTKPSSRIGLQNLSERYRLLTNQEIGIREENEMFIVTLPLLNMA